MRHPKRYVNVHEAKTHFSKLLKRVEKGESVLIARNGIPVAELRPISEKRIERRFGELRGKIVVPDDFNAPLPDEILDLFEGK